MKKVDPYEHVRRENPPPGKIWMNLKGYNRNRAKEEIEKDVEVGVDEYEEEGDEI